MKQKKFDRRLFLNKKTIVNLTDGEMKHGYGGCKHTEVASGCPGDTITCHTWCGETCRLVECTTTCP